MDSYVIRIYRRDVNHPDNMAGQIELVEREETRFFDGIEELMKILTHSEGRNPGSGRTQPDRRKANPEEREKSKHTDKAARCAYCRIRTEGGRYEAV